MKIGDYVRTDIGEIRKVVRVTDDLYVLDKDIVFAHKDKIKKSSSNIIDLIEVGDYVNGLRVNEISEHTIWLDDMRDFEKKDINFVKSIVTKEQFDSMEYKI